MSEMLALLRGVNVGKGNRVPMAEFKAILESLGQQNVHTLLNSGNAVFRSTDRHPEPEVIAKAIAQALHTRLNINTPVIVKTRAQLQSILHGIPLPPPPGDHSRYLIAFGADSAALQGLQPLLALNTPNDQLVLTTEAGYLHCKAGLLESAIAAAMLGKAGRSVTTRNMATVLKLAALFERI